MAVGSEIIVISSDTDISDTEIERDSDSILTFTPTKRYDRCYAFVILAYNVFSLTGTETHGIYNV